MTQTTYPTIDPSMPADPARNHSSSGTISAMVDGPTILLAGGGTGGHLYPGISVAQALVSAMPGVKPVFLCTTREIDKTILGPTGYEYSPQTIIPPTKNIGGLLKFWYSWRETVSLVNKVIRDRKPAAVIGLGGYAAGVAVKIAGEKKIPTLILNPDVIPGKANRYLMRFSRAVCCQFEATREHVPANQQDKLRFTGCPIREDFLKLPSREEASKRLGLDPLRNTLVVTGASQGAQTVNDAILGCAASLNLQGWQILHLSGKEHAPAVRAGYREIDVDALVVDFTPAMADVWAVANLSIARSGASTCAELTACAVPSILLPYPFHKDMHQRANAKVLADAGAAVLLDDKKNKAANSGQLKPVIESLLYDSQRLQQMAASARKLGRPDAADAVAKATIEMLSVGR